MTARQNFTCVSKEDARKMYLTRPQYTQLLNDLKESNLSYIEFMEQVKINIDVSNSFYQLLFTDALRIEYLKKELYSLCYCLQLELKDGANLRDLSQWTYRHRDIDETATTPYLSIADTTSNGLVTRITASPIAKQKALKWFFNLTRPECKRIPKFALNVDLSHDKPIQFREYITKLEFINLF